ncbi:Thiamine-phosphate synthase [compost metagenome]
MIIALTAEEEFASEFQTIHALFEQGLDLLHLRKYHFTDEQMQRYVASIDATYHDRLVLHSHPQLTNSICSTSVHHINQFNTLDKCWNYAFLSPLFPSISKAGYGHHDAVLDQLQSRTNFDVHLIGLGGIKAENCLLSIKAGADGIALLGALWQAPDPIQHFITCKQQLCSKDYSISRRD